MRHRRAQASVSTVKEHADKAKDAAARTATPSSSMSAPPHAPAKAAEAAAPAAPHTITLGALELDTEAFILRKNGETVRTRDFLRIGIPFTLSAVLAGYIYIWLVWGP